MSVLVFIASLFVYGLIIVSVTFATYQFYLEKFNHGLRFSLTMIGALATELFIFGVIAEQFSVFQERFFLSDVLNEWIFIILFFGIPIFILGHFYARKKAKLEAQKVT